MAQEIAIMTPEKVVVAYRVAGLSSRIGAHLLDIALFITFSILINAAIVAALGSSIEPLIAVFFAFSPFIYFIAFEGLWNGQTLGKKAFGLRVRMADGTPITFSAAVFRNLIRPADLLPGVYLVGLLMVFLNPRAQRIGDIAAGTMVVHERLPALVPMVAPHHWGIHQFEDHVGELRRMTRAEYHAVKRLCDRLPTYQEGVRQHLIETVWEPFKQRHEIKSIPGVHDVYLMEAAVVRYSRRHNLL